MNLSQAIKQQTQKTTTDNGATSYSTTNSALLDYFGNAGSMPDTNKTTELFANAIQEDAELAVKTLFYLRDVRGGQGRRDQFKEAIKFLAKEYTNIAQLIINKVPEYGRWDDMYAFVDTPLEHQAFQIMKKQLQEDFKSDTPSLLAKWLKSENTSSKKSRELAAVTRKHFDYNPKQYRKVLSKVRKQIKLIEHNLSNKDYNIDYSSVPSQAMLKYQQAFWRNDADNFKSFLEKVKSGEVKVNTGTLYPHQIVKQALEQRVFNPLSQEKRDSLNTLWDNLPNYIPEGTNNTLCMVDVSGSMAGLPMEAAIAIGIYIAERTKGEFHNKFLTFSAKPSLEELKGGSICEKVLNMSNADWGMNTNIELAFNTILNAALKNKILNEEMPKRLVILSDMQFDMALSKNTWNETIHEQTKKRFESNGYDMPTIVFWNLNGSLNATPVQKDEVNTKLLSGFSTSLLESLLKDDYMTPWEYMLSILNSDRYKNIINLDV